jgi:hypothetical protein
LNLDGPDILHRELQELFGIENENRATGKTDCIACALHIFIGKYSDSRH